MSSNAKNFTKYMYQNMLISCKDRSHQNMLMNCNGGNPNEYMC